MGEDWEGVVPQDLGCIPAPHLFTCLNFGKSLPLRTECFRKFGGWGLPMLKANTKTSSKMKTEKVSFGLISHWWSQKERFQQREKSSVTSLQWTLWGSHKALQKSHASIGRLNQPYRKATPNPLWWSLRISFRGDVDTQINYLPARIKPTTLWLRQ